MYDIIIPEVKFKAWGEEFDAEVRQVGHYDDFTPALQVFDKQTGLPEAKLTVCIPGTVLLPGEYLIKTWAENEPLAAAVLATGVFEDTGRRVGTGHVEAQVWRRVNPS